MLYFHFFKMKEVKENYFLTMNFCLQSTLDPKLASASTKFQISLTLILTEINLIWFCLQALKTSVNPTASVSLKWILVLRVWTNIQLYNASSGFKRLCPIIVSLNCNVNLYHGQRNQLSSLPLACSSFLYELRLPFSYIHFLYSLVT